jgi:hypothetical protein
MKHPHIVLTGKFYLNRYMMYATFVPIDDDARGWNEGKNEAVMKMK